MYYPDDIDKECVVLCDALNSIPGVTTRESCCGHGRKPYRVWFQAENLHSLSLVALIATCEGWSVCAMPHSVIRPIVLILEGPKGLNAYRESEKIADGLLRSEEIFHGLLR